MQHCGNVAIRNGLRVGRSVSTTPGGSCELTRGRGQRAIVFAPYKHISRIGQAGQRGARAVQM